MANKIVVHFHPFQPHLILHSIHQNISYYNDNHTLIFVHCLHKIHQTRTLIRSQM